MEQAFEEQEAILDALDNLVPILRERGIPLRDTAIALPFLPKTMEAVRTIEKLYKLPLDHYELDVWLRQVREAMGRSKQIIQHFSIEQELDLDVLFTQKCRTEDPRRAMDMMAQNNPIFKMTASIFGPNWSHHLDAIKRLSGPTTVLSGRQIPLKTLKAKIDPIANEIMDSFEALMQAESEGRVGAFKERWSRLHSEARSLRLRQFIGLHDRPNLAIHTLAQQSQKSLGQRPFLSPLLNIEDLAQANVLSDLLQTRSTMHPKMFLNADSRFVMLATGTEYCPNYKYRGRFHSSPIPASTREILDTGYNSNLSLWIHA